MAYKVPGAYSADWVDLYNRLYRERILFLGAQVADDIANQMIGIMLYLDSEDNNKPITMYINSPGGSVTAGFAMFDTMRHIKSDVSVASHLFRAGGARRRPISLCCVGIRARHWLHPLLRNLAPCAGVHG